MENFTIYTEKHDFEDYTGLPNNLICLYFIPCSGSNFLADEMRKTGKLGYQLEYFSSNFRLLSAKLMDLPGKLETLRLLHPFRQEELKEIYIKYRGNIILKNTSAWAEENLI